MTKDRLVEAKLTKAQIHALEAMDTWSAGLWLSTKSMAYDGVSLVTLRSLYAADMIDKEVNREGTFWKLLPAGLLALNGDYNAK